MILIFNSILDPKARDNFSDVIAPRITFGKAFRILKLSDKINNLSAFSHLLLSGSELSAANGSSWDDKIISLIHEFYEMNKPILGICYGHQMIARALCGNKSVKKSRSPEFGWKKMSLEPNPIFRHITQPVFLESRYDAVCTLDERFEIIASNEQLNIQAFQMKDRPVWGVQFHPEMLWKDGKQMLENHFQKNPEDRRYFQNELENPALIPDNLNIFRNFWKT